MPLCQVISLHGCTITTPCNWITVNGTQPLACQLHALNFALSVKLVKDITMLTFLIKVVADFRMLSYNRTSCCAIQRVIALVISNQPHAATLVTLVLYQQEQAVQSWEFPAEELVAYR